ncbi:MAG: baseplate assembly protein [Gammaproteobacteria bacterium]|nr:baseplate assembly protein [Gammaproteobacteria bacterium]NVK86995.1 baseplate assembly protein [Gammaproteobacteria bacterium]
MNRLDEIESWIRSHFFGKYRGVVVDNLDPLGQKGRLQVKVPAVLGDNPVWAMPCVPYAGSDVGFYCLPPVDAGIWIEFEGGDPSYPIWTGCFWSDGQLPSEVLTAENRLWKTQSAQITIDDNTGEVEVSNQQNVSTVWSTDVATTAGSSTHTVGGVGVVSESAPGKVEVGAGGVTINNGAFKVT